MIISPNIKTPGFERVFHICGDDIPAEIIIPIHNTSAGVAIGGWRIYPYGSFEAMRYEALSLACSMTKKALMAGINAGGGKMVVRADPNDPHLRTETFYRSVAHALNTVNINGHIFSTAEDAGTSTKDIAAIAPFVREDRYLVGRVDPSPYTAHGVLCGMRAAMQFIGRDLRGATIAIQGLGKVGMALAEALRSHYPAIRILGSDTRVDQWVAVTNIKRLMQERAREVDIELVSSKEIHRQPCDIFAPCAVGFALNPEIIRDLRCRIVAGAQNNQLGEPPNMCDRLMWERNILYVPDYIINAGGIISCAKEVTENGHDPDEIRDAIEMICHSISSILETALATNTPPGNVADQAADLRLAKITQQLHVG